MRGRAEWCVSPPGVAVRPLQGTPTDRPPDDHPHRPSGAIEISVCVCTHRRPAGLLRLLRSLRHLDQATRPHEIIVVDNDAGRAGEVAVNQARAEGLRVAYLVEPERGIARARNRSVRPARGEYVAFIDDDEEADPLWLVRLWEEVTRHGADGGVGPVIPAFGDAAPRWLVDGGFFERRRFPTGTALGFKYLRTGNALIRRRCLMDLAGPFDERFDLTGGEDTNLYSRLVAAGYRFIAVDSAIVREHLAPSRTNPLWLLHRRFVGSRCAAGYDYASLPPSERRKLTFASLRKTLWSGLTGALLFATSRIGGLRRLIMAATQLGRFAYFCGFSSRPYQRESWR